MKRMNKITAILLALVLCLGLCPTAFAAEPVTPTPPDWMPAEYYLVFPGDEVYLPENWAKVLEMRSDAANGGKYDLENVGYPTGSAGMQYEIALVRLKYAENMGGVSTQDGRRTYNWAGQAFRSAGSTWSKVLEEQGIKEKDGLRRQLDLWYYRIDALSDPGLDIYMRSFIYQLLEDMDMTLDEFFDAPFIETMDEAGRVKVAEAVGEHEAGVKAEQARIKIVIDGEHIKTDVDPENRNGRTMVPVRVVSETLGADVDWDGATSTVKLTRAGATISMTIGSATAAVDGKTVQLDAPPYISGGRTMVPVRFISEYFGQNVDWDGSTNTVTITEDKSAAGESNLEAWALPMGAMLAYLNQGDFIFGLYNRGGNTILPATGGIAPPGGGDYEFVLPVERCRLTLSQSWNINSREDLILTVCSMTTHGHNDSFLEDVAYIKSLTPAQYNQYLKSDGMDSYMFPYTKQLGEKWGERGILCWDLFRMSNLVQWGYVAGYVTYPEALALLEPAATLLCENFSSWEEAYENYLEGYNWWARNDILDEDIWSTGRGITYRTISKSAIFNDTLFETGIIPVPGLTAQQLLDEVLAD